jgi:hypothetical protein
MPDEMPDEKADEKAREWMAQELVNEVKELEEEESVDGAVKQPQSQSAQ